MEINWQAPFELAWQLGLFLTGVIAILLVVIIAILITYGLVKGFFTALKRARTPKESPQREAARKAVNAEGNPVLKPVK